MLFEVRYEILTEARTDSYMGSSRSDLQNLVMRVEATNPRQAELMVESMNGGHSRCRIYSAYPV